VRAASDTVLCMFDEVPKWVAVMPNKLLVTAAEAAEKRRAARRRASLHRGRSDPPAKRPSDQHVQDIISGPQGRSGAEKFRITTIMLQFVRNWFNEDLEPLGEIGLTVCIFLGSTARLEDIDEHGVSRSTGQLLHPQLMGVVVAL